jgi:ABC-type lipoprotein export system ATPase subunit
VLLVTHNPGLAQIAHRVIELRDGKIHNSNSS